MYRGKEESIQKLFEPRFRLIGFGRGGGGGGGAAETIDLSSMMGNIKGIASGLSIKRFHPRLAALSLLYALMHGYLCPTICMCVFACLYICTRARPHTQSLRVRI